MIGTVESARASSTWLTTLRIAPGNVRTASPCDASYNNGVVFQQVSSMLCKVALVDCRHGEAIWADAECQAHTFSENQVENLTRKILKRLP